MIIPHPLRRGLRWSLRAVSCFLVIFILPLGCAVTGHYFNGDRAHDWRTARRDSTGLAPDPATVPEAVIQVYAARAFRWRGAFGVHTWIAVKPSGARQYTRLEVIGFGVARGAPAVRVATGVADGYWFGNHPRIIRELRGGEEIDTLIERLVEAAGRYPYNDVYAVWPGPNSNTFIAYLGREVPELRLDLPPTAIGKDYLTDGSVIATSPSGTGIQASLGGLAGVLLAAEEGLEVNLLGLTAGIDLWPPALKLPGIGRLGFPEHRGGS